MSKKNKKEKPKIKSNYSDAGKGDKSRVSDTNKYAKNWEKIFGKKKKKKIKNDWNCKYVIGNGCYRCSRITFYYCKGN